MENYLWTDKIYSVSFKVFFSLHAMLASQIRLSDYAEYFTKYYI